MNQKQMINSRTKLCAVIGHPVAHSLSPEIHNAAFKEKGLNFAYLAFDVMPNTLRKAIDAMRALDFRGYSITIPHKIAALQFVDSLDPIAKKIGAINTIVNEKGKLIGYNTDVIGAIKALEQKINLNGKRVLLIGAGGAARGIGFGLKEKNSIITISNRTEEKGIALSNSLGCNFAKFNELPNLSFDVLINATSMGMHPNINETIVSEGVLNKKMLVFDIVYNPIKTKLIKAAEKKGIETVSGIEMLSLQAAAQFELFTGEKAPLNLMRKIAIENLVKK